MIFKDYYSILEILPEATQKEIVFAYKSMAKKWHPDKNPGVDTTTRMQLISEAYKVLKNIEKRKMYNTEYFRYYQSKIQNQQKTEVRIEKCYYCGKNIANHKFSYKKTFYKETNRSYFPQRKVWYKTINVEIPRCEICNNIHNSGSGLFVLFPLISFAILGLILGRTILGMWFLFLIVGGFVGGILGAILTSIDNSIIAKDAGIKKESDISGFEPISILYKDNWTTDKPTA